MSESNRARDGWYLEFVWWAVVAVLSMWDFWRDLLGAGGPAHQHLIAAAQDRPLPFISGPLVLLFLWLFYLIFGALPAKTVWSRIGQVRARRYRGSTAMPSAEISDLNPRAALTLFAQDTASIATKLYGRAGVYLLVGVLVAFTGLGFFYFGVTNAMQQAGLVSAEQTRLLEEAAFKNGAPSANWASILTDARQSESQFLLAKLTDLLPRFGILFFVEFVAFFFLRQYRAAMDEFRYFDSIRRHREENLVILQMFAERPGDFTAKDVLANMKPYSGPATLARGQTTERLETRRLDPDESLVFEKLLDVVFSMRASDRNNKKP